MIWFHLASQFSAKHAGSAVPSGTCLSSVSEPSSAPREQEPVAKGPDEVALGVRTDSPRGDHEDKHAYNDRCLCRQRPDAVRYTTDRGGLPPPAEPSGEPPEDVAETGALNQALAGNGMAPRVHEQNRQNQDDDCGLSPKRPGDLRPKTEYEIPSDKQPKCWFGRRCLFEVLEVLQHLCSMPLQIWARIEFQKQSIDCQGPRCYILLGVHHGAMSPSTADGLWQPRPTAARFPPSWPPAQVR